MERAMFIIKNLEVLNLHPKLITIVNEVEEIAGPGLYTSAYRPGDSGVHGQIPVRGIDRRCRYEGVGRAICNYVNARWAYDLARPEKECALFHEVKDSQGRTKGWHLHFQVHPNTEKR